jgi:hypothetical protein
MHHLREVRMTETARRAIFFDSGNTLIFPRLEELART